MKINRENSQIPAIKDEKSEHPIPTTWCPVIREIIRAFSHHDYRLSTGVPGVVSISPEKAEQIEAYIQDYGADLIELPEDAWASSVCIWMGSRWDALIDLWTSSEGRSDLVLSLQVSEAGGGFEYNVYMVYVP